MKIHKVLLTDIKFLFVQVYSVWIVPIQQQLQRIESKFEMLPSTGTVGQLKVESATTSIPKEQPHMKPKGPPSKHSPHKERLED